MTESTTLFAAHAAPLSSAALASRTIRNLGKSFNWAWLDVVCQYRRSRIGPWWETINAVVMIGGLTLVSSAVFGGNVRALVGYIGMGVVVWFAISAIVTEGSMTFTRNASFVTSSNISVDMYVGRTVFKILIVFGHHVILYLVAVMLGLAPIGWASLLALPGIVLLFVNGFLVVAILGFICARFRDVELIVRNLLQLAFFLTPVFWDHHQVASDRRFVVDFNVLFYFIEIIRSPLLGQVPPLRYYIVVLTATVLGIVFAVLTYRRMRRNLAFFV